MSPAPLIKPAPPPPCNARWVRLAIMLAAAVYSILIGYGFWADPHNIPARSEEIATLLAILLGLWFSRHRPRTAAALVMVAIWCELMLAISHWGVLGGGALIALPMMVVAAGMVLGVRGSNLVAVSTCIVLPLVSLVWPWSLPGAQPLVPVANGNLVLVTELVTIAAAFLTRAIILSYQRSLVESERARHRYGELFALAPDGLLELDERGVVSDANAAALRLLGIDRAGVVGTALASVLKRADATECVDLTNVPPGTPLVVTLGMHSENPRILEISVQQRLGPNARSLLIVRDVTARRKLEERVAHTQRLETVGRLAGGVAHDFNNLLTVVGGNASLMANYPDPDVREMMADIMEAHRRGVNLTRQLLAFARRDVRNPEVLDLGASIMGMTRLLERLLGEQHRLALDVATAIVRADRGQIEQLLLNLVSNARDATSSGGIVTVRCEELDREESKSLGSSLEAERQAMLAVVDNGCGMSPEVQAKLFEPFFTTKPRGRGTGLGLSMVHGIVLQSDGAIHVHSAVGLGTTVRVFLPACAEMLPPAETASVADVTSLLGTEHILLVEDDVSVRRFVERVLVDSGYRVTNANNSSSALAVFAAAKPPIDLVLTDIVMPGMSGLELAAKLAAEHNEVPVLFMSGHFEAREGSQALDPQRNLLAKPFSADALRRRVSEFLHAAKRKSGAEL
jgi:two-component system, cell cycle sensor histidine kinase and response regulator CckA